MARADCRSKQAVHAKVRASARRPVPAGLRPRNGALREEAQGRFWRAAERLQWFAFETTPRHPEWFPPVRPDVSRTSARRGCRTHVQKLRQTTGRWACGPSGGSSVPRTTSSTSRRSSHASGPTSWSGRMGFRLQNPMTYSRVPGEGIDALLKRDFAPAPEQLKSVIARLQGRCPRLRRGKANMKRHPMDRPRASDGERRAGLPPGLGGTVRDGGDSALGGASTGPTPPPTRRRRTESTSWRRTPATAERRELGHQRSLLLREAADRGDGRGAAGHAAWPRARPSSRPTTGDADRPARPGGRR